MCEVCLLDPNLILCEAEINGGHLPRFHSTRLTVHVLVQVCACVCVMTFPQRARARFISHKHEPMDPITLRRYVCLLSSVKSKDTREGRRRRVLFRVIMLCGRCC